MWIGSLQNCENEPLGVKCKTCVKFLGIYITYDVQIFSTFAPYDQGGLKMLDYDNMIKALRLSWLKQIVNPDFFGFWSYLDQLFVNEGGLFLIQCNYDINRLTISATFYRELLDWWSKLREVKDPEGIHRFILWNNNEKRIDGKSVFYKHLFDNNIIYTTQLLYEMTNIESFNVVRDEDWRTSTS